MTSILLPSLVFIFILVFSALAFGGWVIVTLFKGVGQLIRLLFMPDQLKKNQPPIGYRGPRPSPAAQRPSPMPYIGPVQLCAFPRCKAPNPAAARFCRRCGRKIESHVAAAQPQRVAV